MAKLSPSQFNRRKPLFNSKFSAALTLLFISSHGLAMEATPESLERLCVVTAPQAAIEGINRQLISAMKKGTEQSFNTENMQPSRRVEVDQYIGRVIAKSEKIVDEHLSHSFFKSLCVDVFRVAYTQEEVNARLAFSETPHGKRLIQSRSQAVSTVLANMFFGAPTGNDPKTNAEPPEANVINQNLSGQAIRAEMHQALVESVSESDRRAIEAFVSTPEGQSIENKQPIIRQGYEVGLRAQMAIALKAMKAVALEMAKEMDMEKAAKMAQ